MKRWAPPAVLALVFLASRALAHAAGLKFSLFPLEWYWQYLPVAWLRDDLARGLYYMHDQPPLFNMYLGGVLKLLPGHEALAFQGSYMGLGLAFVLTLYALQRRLGVAPWLACALAALFAVAPATILYELWLFYAYPTAALLAFGALALAAYLERRTFWRALAFFGLLAVLALTRSMYHLAWLVAIAGGLAWVLPAERRRLALAAAGPVALVALWYAKNLLVFGVFAGSSSVGMSFAKVSLGESRPELRQAFHERGLVSDLAVVGPWRPLEDYPARYWRLPPTGISLLDAPRKPSGEPNFHHLAYVDIARQFGQDALTLMRYRPDIYLKGVARATLLYLQPASNYQLLVENRRVLLPYEHAYNALVLGKWPTPLAEDQPLPPPGTTPWQRWGGLLLGVGYFQAVAFPLLALFGWRQLRRPGAPEARILIAFMLFNIAWVTATSNLVEVGDNNRYRYDVDGFYLALLALALQRRRAHG